MSSVFRKEYRPLNDEQKHAVEQIKTIADELLEAIRLSGANISIDPRYAALAKTALEESVMWAVKAIT